jgi:very-short-patch-repair endonuclease
MTNLKNDHSSIEKRRSLRRNQTDAEKRLWQALRNKQIGGYKFFRQYSIGGYVLDFYCPARKLAIESDGSQHMDNTSDEVRTKYLQLFGAEVIRFWNNQLFQEFDAVISLIYQKLNKTEDSDVQR